MSDVKKTRASPKEYISQPAITRLDNEKEEDRRKNVAKTERPEHRGLIGNSTSVPLHNQSRHK